MAKKQAKKKTPVKVVSVRKKKPAKKESKNSNAIVNLALKIDSHLGRYAFAVGVIAALIFAFTNQNYLPKEYGIFLIIIGLIIGLINITHKERAMFLIAAIALIVTNGANLWSISLWNIGPILQVFMRNLAILFAPAALLVALETIYELASNR